MPVPRGGFKADMIVLGEMPNGRPPQANSQKKSANQHVKSVKTRCHEKVRTVNVARIIKRRVAIFIRLKNGENRAQNNRAEETLHQGFAVIIMHQSVVRPSAKTTRTEQNQSVNQG